MNPLTQIRNTQKATLSEVCVSAACSLRLRPDSSPQVTLGISEKGSWHARYKHSAYAPTRRAAAAAAPDAATASL